jgi:hypothetical protein
MPEFYQSRKNAPACLRTEMNADEPVPTPSTLLGKSMGPA